MKGLQFWYTNLSKHRWNQYYFFVTPCICSKAIIFLELINVDKKDWNSAIIAKHYIYICTTLTRTLKSVFQICLDFINLTTVLSLITMVEHLSILKKNVWLANFKWNKKLPKLVRKTKQLVRTKNVSVKNKIQNKSDAISKTRLIYILFAL